MKRTAIILAAVMLAGCATGKYNAYLQTAEKISSNESKVEVADKLVDSKTVEGLTAISISPHTSPEQKASATMALALRGAGKTAGQRAQTQIAAPGPDPLLQWAQILAPALTNLGMAAINANVAKVQSNNSARVAESTNATFLGMAGHIQAPMAPAANVTTTTTTTDARVTDNSVFTSTDNSQRTADSGNVTTSTTSTWGANSGANSGNSGRIAGTSMSDSTTPAPAPIIVPAPAPQVVYPVVVNPVVVQP